MIFSQTTLALLALLPFISASPTPLQKRYTGVLIRSGRQDAKGQDQCLSLRPGFPVTDGSFVYGEPCWKATKWDINPGSGSVLVSGHPNFALDAGSKPGNFERMKVWTSYPGLMQQTWYLTNDNRIAITGGDQCLDMEEYGKVQTYKCTTGNTNQVWTVDTKTVSPPPGEPVGSPPQNQVVWLTDPTMCLTVSPNVIDGSPVTLQKCANATEPHSAAQRFITFQNVIASGDHCLDAGWNPANGSPLQMWKCSGVPQQKFTYQDGLISTSNNQCVNVKNSDNKSMQTWACSAPDPQEKFFYRSI